MTKEELEKEARFRTKGWKEQENCVQAYLAGAEPREKQIQIDAKQIRALQKQNGELTDELTKKAGTNHQLIEQMAELTDRVKELEAQIEKMKCCENCQHHYFDNYDVISCAEEKDVTNKKCKFWELSIERR